MAPVESWFTAFIRRHTTRCHREDWPKAGAFGDREKARIFYAAWVPALEARGIDEQDAEAASIRMAAEPPAFLAEHLPTLLKFGAEHRRKAEESVAKAPEPAAEETSLTPEQLRAFRTSIGLSATPGDRRVSGSPRSLKVRFRERPRPERAERTDRPALSQPDPVIDAEFQPSKPATSDKDVCIPEDDAASGWY